MSGVGKNRRRTYKVEMQALGAADFQKAFTEINKTLVNIQNNSKRVEHSIAKGLGKALKAQTAETKTSNDLLRKMSAALDNQTKAMDRLTKATHGNGAALNELIDAEAEHINISAKGNKGRKKTRKAVQGNTVAIKDNTVAVTGNTAAIGKAGDAYNKTAKGAERLSAGAGSAGRAMADLSISSGPLVRSYALIAANFFALQQTVSVLMEGEQLFKLENNLANIGKTAEPVSALAVSMQALTAGALSYQDALRQSARVTAYAFSSEELEKMTVAARRASIALGINLSDAMDRIIRGVQKQEVEVLDEIGVVTRLEVAFKRFSEENNVAVKAMTDSQRKTALLNEVLRQTESQFGNVNLEAGLIEKTLSNLSTTVGYLTKSIAELLNAGGPVGLGAAITALGVGLTSATATKSKNARVDKIRKASNFSAVGPQIPSGTTLSGMDKAFDIGTAKLDKLTKSSNKASRALGFVGKGFQGLARLLMANPIGLFITIAVSSLVALSGVMAEYAENKNLMKAVERDIKGMHDLGAVIDKTDSQLRKYVTYAVSLSDQADGLFLRAILGKDGVTSLKTAGKAGEDFLKENKKQLERLATLEGTFDVHKKYSKEIREHRKEYYALRKEVEKSITAFNELNDTEIELDTTRALAKKGLLALAMAKLEASNLLFKDIDAMKVFKALQAEAALATKDTSKAFSDYSKSLEVKTGLESLVKLSSEATKTLRALKDATTEHTDVQKDAANSFKAYAKSLGIATDIDSIQEFSDKLQLLHERTKALKDLGNIHKLNQQFDRLDPSRSRKAEDAALANRKAYLKAQLDIFHVEMNTKVLSAEAARAKALELGIINATINADEEILRLNRIKSDTLAENNRLHTLALNAQNNLLPIIGKQTNAAQAEHRIALDKLAMKKKEQDLLAQKDTMEATAYAQALTALEIDKEQLEITNKRVRAQAAFNDLLAQQAQEMALFNAASGLANDKISQNATQRDRGRLGFSNNNLLATDTSAAQHALTQASINTRGAHLQAQLDTKGISPALQAELIHKQALLAVEQARLDIQKEVSKEDQVATQIDRVKSEMGNIFQLDEAGGSVLSGLTDLHGALSNLSDIDLSTVFTTGAKGMDVLASGLKAGASIMSGFSKQAADDIQFQIDMEKKRDGKSAESQKKIAALEKKKMKEMQKAKLQQAVMATAAGIAESLSLPFPGNLIMAGIVGAMGAVQIAQIKKKGAQEAALANAGAGSDPMKLSLGKLDRQVDTKNQATGSELDLLRGMKPGRSTGGEIMPGHGYVVGENGPEIVSPSIPMTVHSASDSENMGMGGGITLAPVINTLDARSFADRIPEVSRELVAALEMELNNKGISLNQLRR